MQEYNDKRKYIRLNSVFPVEFSLYFTPEKPASGEYQGFTSNVSEGGLCLNIKNLKPEDEKLILQHRAALKMLISIPLFAKPVDATAEIAWSRRDEKDPSNKSLLIGLSYKEIEPKDKNRIVSYARRLKWLPRIAATAIMLLFLSLLFVSTNHIIIKRHNQELVSRLVSVSDIKSKLEKTLNEAEIRKDMLEAKLKEGTGEENRLISDIEGIETKMSHERERLDRELKDTMGEQSILKEKIKELSSQKRVALDKVRDAETASAALKEKIDAISIELAEVEGRSKKKIESLHTKLNDMQKENKVLKQELAVTGNDEALLEEQLAQLRAATGDIEKASVDTMLEWIITHQTKRTGLIVSFEGDKDLKDIGFTYDQALAVQAFLISGYNEKASAILDFYKNEAAMSNGLFYNAYDVKSSSAREYIVHSGPNIWIGISVCQYTNQTGDNSYISLAEDIAGRMIELQRSSSDGSIKGGPEVEWVSTEHNLDAYALFNMLFHLTSEARYKTAAATSLNWLKDAGYNRPEGRFMRGRGDATIATDTFSWAIASLGPEVLFANKMSPDAVMEFAETECRVEVKFYRPENKQVEVAGFDFAKAQNVGRGGVISTEWTGQMIVAFDIMADYYQKKDNQIKEKIYRSKARYYLAELGKMVISSPSPTGQGEGCLPYASMDNVDTGHGWRVAKGRRTGSVAATIYYIFAYKSYNPLAF